MRKPAGLRITFDTPPVPSPRTTSTKAVGSRAAPVEVAAGQRIPRVHARRRHLREIAAGPHLLQPRHRALLARSDLIGRRLLRHRHEDVRQQVLSVAAVARRRGREELFDLRVSRPGPALHLAFAQPLRRHLATDVLAVLGVRDVLLLEHPAELVGGQVVVLGDALHRALGGDVVDAHAGFLRVLQQRALRDAQLEHLAIEHLGRWRGHLRLAHLHQHRGALLRDLLLRDRLVVDHRDDADGAAAGACACTCATPAASAAASPSPTAHGRRAAGAGGGEVGEPTRRPAR
jgi:hypothetical protein